MHALEFKKNLCKEQVIALEPYGKQHISSENPSTSTYK